MRELILQEFVATPFESGDNDFRREYGGYIRIIGNAFDNPKLLDAKDEAAINF